MAGTGSCFQLLRIMARQGCRREVFSAPANSANLAWLIINEAMMIEINLRHGIFLSPAVSSQRGEPDPVP